MKKLAIAVYLKDIFIGAIHTDGCESLLGPITTKDDIIRSMCNIFCLGNGDILAVHHLNEFTIKGIAM